MSGFGDILKQGKKRFDIKKKRGSWGVCDDCANRKYLFSYSDNKKEVWRLCDSCSDSFIKDEG